VNNLKGILSRLFSSGYYLDNQDIDQYEIMSKIIFLNVACTIALMLFSFFTIAGIIRNEPQFHVIFTTLMFVFVIINLVIINVYERFDLASSFIILIIMITSCETVSFGADRIKEYTIFFTFSYPVLVFYLKNKRSAIYWLIPFFSYLIIYMLLISFKVVIGNHSIIKLIFAIISLGIISILLFFMKIKNKKY